MYDKIIRDKRISRGYTDGNPWVPDWAGKMKKVLYTSGCSHTAGTEIAMEGRLDLTWPNILSDRLEYNLIDSSKIGASNDYIFKKTVEDISSLGIPPDLVVIQFTSPQRFEGPDHTFFNPHSYIRRIEDKSHEDYLEAYDFFKKYLADTDRNFKYYEENMIRQMYMLSLFFQEFGVHRYIFLRWTVIRNPTILKKYIICKHFNFDNHLFGSNPHGVMQHLLHNGYDRYSGEDRHFGKEAHNQISHWIFQHLYNIPHTDLKNSQYDDREDKIIYTY
jgi:hypothetical protein